MEREFAGDRCGFICVDYHWEEITNRIIVIRNNQIKNIPFYRLSPFGPFLSYCAIDPHTWLSCATRGLSRIDRECYERLCVIAQLKRRCGAP
jgi:hypothetical protein